MARGIGKDETQASLKVFQTLQQRGHPDGPPPLISDGWGGIDDAMLAVYGLVPEYSGRGRPPAQPQPGEGWLYLQMVKQRDDHGRLRGVKLKAVWGGLDELMGLLGQSTAYIERSNLTAAIQRPFDPQNPGLLERPGIARGGCDVGRCLLQLSSTAQELAVEGYG